MNDMHSVRSYDAAAITSDVAKDMASIFGQGVGTPPGLPALRRAPTPYSGKRGRLIAAVVAGTMVTGISVGVVAGSRAIDAPAAAPSSVPSERKSAVRVRSEPRRVATADASPAPGRLSDAPAAVLAAASVPARDVDDAVDPSSSARAEAIVEKAVAPAVVAPISRPSPTASTERTAPATATATPTICDDDSDACIASRIGEAERHLTVAYEEAIAAGVRPRVLRGYRNEWIRAQGEARARPYYALRLYDMITADLYTFADETGARAW